MKTLLNTFILLFCSTTLLAQDTTPTLKKGDVLVLGKPSRASYKHIDFPRKNSIIKRGGIANFNALLGKRLVVHDLETDENGEKIATLVRQDGLKFFRFYPKVRATLNKALESEELKRVATDS